MATGLPGFEPSNYILASLGAALFLFAVAGATSAPVWIFLGLISVVLVGAARSQAAGPRP